jgi:hypothetical protein
MLLVLGLPSFAAAQSLDILTRGVGAMSGSLGPLLESQLGVTADQANGGVGSILSLAQERLDAGDFAELTKLVPGASGYMDAAKRLGAVTGPLRDVSGLNAALGRLGMSAETAEQFVPMVADYLGKLGDQNTQKLLAAVLKPA